MFKEFYLYTVRVSITMYYSHAQCSYDTINMCILSGDGSLLGFLSMLL